MVKQDNAFAYHFDGYYRDIDTVEEYFAANMDFVSPQPAFTLDGEWPIEAAQSLLPAANVSKKSRIVNSIVSPGCTIKGLVENSVISPGVWIDDDAFVKNSVLIGNIFIGQNSIVESCLIDEGVSIGRFCYIGARKCYLPVTEGIRILEMDMIIPPYTILGHSKVGWLDNEIPATNRLTILLDYLEL